MTVMPVMPRDHDVWTVHDLDRLPEDGLQYELFDGVLLVSPAPRPIHQRALGSLYRTLHAACPEHLEVFMAPLDFQPTLNRSAQPDLLVVRPEDLGPDRVEGTPVLAVEILSVSTRSKDRIIKQEIYRAAGVPSFWIVDPGDLAERSVPTIEIYQLYGDTYVLDATIVGDQGYTVREPFSVRLCPSALIAR